MRARRIVAFILTALASLLHSPASATELQAPAAQPAAPKQSTVLNAAPSPTAATTTFTPFVQQEIELFIRRDGEGTAPWTGYARMLGYGTAVKWDGPTFEWFAWADRIGIPGIETSIRIDEITMQKINLSGYRCPEGRCDASDWLVEYVNEESSSIRLFYQNWVKFFCPENSETQASPIEQGLGCRHADLLEDISTAFKSTGAFTDFKVTQVF